MTEFTNSESDWNTLIKEMESQLTKANTSIVAAECVRDAPDIPFEDREHYNQLVETLLKNANGLEALISDTKKKKKRYAGKAIYWTVNPMDLDTKTRFEYERERIVF